MSETTKDNSNTFIAIGVFIIVAIMIYMHSSVIKEETHADRTVSVSSK